MGNLKRSGAFFAAFVLLASVLGTCLTGCGQNGVNETQNVNEKGDEIMVERDTTPIPAGEELVQTLAADSMVLLKNENDCLPLAQGTKLNLFGYNTTDSGFLLVGGGSGGNRAASKHVSLVKALEDAGVEINRELLSAYQGWDTLDLDHNSATDAPQCILSNPGADFYTAELLQQAKDFSDTAVVVLSRWGRENGKLKDDTGKLQGEIPLMQIKSGMPTDYTRTYLEISTEEEYMLKTVRENFSKVIVLVNTCNTMELGFLDEMGIDAAMYVGMPGMNGTRVIPKLLYGEINPSGKTADVYALEHQADPTFVNRRPDYSNDADKNVSYLEGIYYGYRWYETAFADGVKFSVNGYDLDFTSEEGYRRSVQYPFGYGLSYTTFSWELVEAPAAALTDGTTVHTVKVKVTNTGKVAGKDVVQLYVTAPYTPGGIEKAAVSLVDFGKTDSLQPGESQELTLSFTGYDLASYDCYDANKNGFAGYEVEKGTYELKLMRDSHTLSEAGSFTMKAEADVLIDKDPVTGETVQNLFTGEDSFGSPVDGGLTYMTRADFAGTFPTQQMKGAKTKTEEITYQGELKKIEYGQDNGLYLVTLADGSKASLADLTGLTDNELVWNKELLFQLADYDNEEIWDKFLSQLTKTEIQDMIKDGGFKTRGTVSIGLYETVECDGPCALNAVPEIKRTGWSWNKELLYLQGRSIGEEARKNDVQAWYAPGVNLHRSPYTSRNHEYYSEDPILSGKLAGQVIKGAKNEGLITYLKHFAVSEGGKNPSQVNTWLTEQNLREVYLKAFEIAVKDGKTNGIMSAFNNIGDIYCGHNQALLQDVLRTEWGFRGAVITDWWGEYMMIEQCVYAGNDKMLLKKDTQQYVALMKNDGPMANAARVAVKNLVYSIVDTCIAGGLYEQSFRNVETEEATDVGGSAAELG